MDLTKYEDECRSLVLGFCREINEWEQQHYLLSQIARGASVPERRRKLVEGLTIESHLQKHADIFNKHILPRVRKRGSNPGAPASFGSDGRFFDVEADTIKSVSFPNDQTANVITDWGFLLPIGQTMFILKHHRDRWLIDSLKSGSDNDWRNALL